MIPKRICAVAWRWMNAGALKMHASWNSRRATALLIHALVSYDKPRAGNILPALHEVKITQNSSES